MPTIPELLESNFSELSINDFIVKMLYLADKAEHHLAFQGDTPEYVSKAPQIRVMADALGKARDAASGGDKDNSAEKKRQWAAAKLALSMNASHVTMLSLAKNDASLLANSGYEAKQKAVNKAVNLLDLAPEVFAKHAGATGALIVLVKRAKANASIELQSTEQDPALEASWSGTLGIHTKSRIEMKGLEPARRIHLRARYHEEGNAGPWSAPITIIVL